MGSEDDDHDGEPAPATRAPTATGTGSEAGPDLLRSKRAATRYQILVEIAERQPAVSQREVADAIGITPQAVSDYLADLADDGFVRTHGRGRYEVTKEGVDWLISRTDALESFVSHVATDVIGQVDVEAAIAMADLDSGDRVTLEMSEGVLHAAPAETVEQGAGATAVAVTDAAAGMDVGVTDFEGLLDYDLGTVTVIVVPPVAEGGSRAVDPERVAPLVGDHDRLAVAGAEALALARAADASPDLVFGTPAAVREAAAKGLDVLLLSVAATLSAHTDELREAGIGYEVVDPTEG